MKVTRYPAFFIDGNNAKLRRDLPVVPNSSDGAALGSSSLMWSDLFLASGAVINFNNGDVTITHSANGLAFGGVTGGYQFDDDVAVANNKGFVGKDTSANEVALLRANSNDDAHFMAGVGNGSNNLTNAYGAFNAPVPFEFGGSCCGGAPPTSFSFNTSGSVSWKVSDSTKVYFSSAGNLKIGGTASRATTEGTAQLVLFNGTAPVGTLTNGVSFYSASGEARVMDAAGNSTLLSPHDKKTNEWIFNSKNTVTGKKLTIKVERMLRKLDEMLGGGYIEDELEEI